MFNYAEAFRSFSFLKNVLQFVYTCIYLGKEHSGLHDVIGYNNNNNNNNNNNIK